jgi:hypothetical protein
MSPTWIIHRTDEIGARPPFVLRTTAWYSEHRQPSPEKLGSSERSG